MKRIISLLSLLILFIINANAIDAKADCNFELLNFSDHDYFPEGKFSHVNITWDGNADLYEIEYGLKGFEKGSGTIEYSSVNSVDIMATNLVAYSEYDYYVRARCEDTWGEWSVRQEFMTPIVYGSVMEEEFSVTFEIVSKNFIRTTWSRTNRIPLPGRYIIEYGPKGFERGKGKTEAIWGDQAALFQLLSDTEYSFFIRSDKNSAEAPVWFIEHTFKTPERCNNTQITDISWQEDQTNCGGCDAAIRISWGDFADAYEIEFGEKGFQKGTGTIIEAHPEMHLSYPELKGHTDYSFYLRAKCDDIFGEWSNIQHFTTGCCYNSIEQNTAPAFVIYPNPLTEEFSIDFDSKFNRNSVQISVNDMQGKLCKSFKVQNIYNIGDLPVGLYIVIVSDGNYSESQIIQKR